MAVTASVLAAALVGVAVQPVHGKPDDPCKQCKPSKAEWGWKANGYALGVDADAAKAAARQQAIDSACKASNKYLDPQKLPCRRGCNDGGVETSCEPTKKQGCSTGTYDDNKGMWMFVCRKEKQVTDSKVSCDTDEAAKRPGWSMCDVGVTAVKQRTCVHPDCKKEEPKPDE